MSLRLSTPRQTQPDGNGGNTEPQTPSGGRTAGQRPLRAVPAQRHVRAHQLRTASPTPAVSGQRAPHGQHSGGLHARRQTSVHTCRGEGTSNSSSPPASRRCRRSPTSPSPPSPRCPAPAPRRLPRPALTFAYQCGAAPPAPLPPRSSPPAPHRGPRAAGTVPDPLATRCRAAGTHRVTLVSEGQARGGAAVRPRSAVASSPSPLLPGPAGVIPAAPKRWPRAAAQIPWSQSTSRQMYQRIT